MRRIRSEKYTNHTNEAYYPHLLQMPNLASVFDLKIFTGIMSLRGPQMF